MKIESSEYPLKFAMLQEYKKVLTYKKMYEDLIEAFQYIISDLFEYSNKNKIDLPHRDRIYRNMEKARELIEYRIEKTSKSHTVIKKTSDENLQDDEDSENRRRFDGTLIDKNCFCHLKHVFSHTPVVVGVNGVTRLSNVLATVKGTLFN